MSVTSSITGPGMCAMPGPVLAKPVVLDRGQQTYVLTAADLQDRTIDNCGTASDRRASTQLLLLLPLLRLLLRQGPLAIYIFLNRYRLVTGLVGDALIEFDVSLALFIATSVHGF